MNRKGTVTKDVSFPALYQFKKIYEICLKPECDKHIFKIGKGRPSKDHYSFIDAIDNRKKSSRKFKYLKDVIKVDGYKDLALQSITIPLDASDKLKRVFVLLGLLQCGNDNTNILSEFSALLVDFG